MEAYFITDIGKVRSQNEDSGGIFYNKGMQTLAIVADGMGGHSGGDVASKLTTNFIQEEWESTTTLSNPKAVEEWIEDAILKVNHLIYQEAKENPDLEGMGTTLVLAVCTDEFITIAHIGDSRCYLYNNDELKQLTEDHTLVNELLRAGQISPDDAIYHPRKNVLSRALGTEIKIQCEIQTMVWEVGDKLLLCSDGLTNKVENEELLEFLQRDEEISDTGEQLINLANERGGEDNISIAILHHEQLERAGEAE